MKKCYFPILILALLVSAACGRKPTAEEQKDESQKTARENLGYKGDVKSVETTKYVAKYDLKGNVVIDSVKETSYLYFDKYGNLTKGSETLLHGRVNETTAEYEGKALKRLVTTVEGDTTLHLIVTNDPKWNKPIKVTTFSNNDWLSGVEQLISYDEKGKIKSSVYRNQHSIVTTDFDSLENPIRVVFSDTLFNLSQDTRSEYFAKNKLEKQFRNDTLIKKNVYDTKGNLAEEHEWKIDRLMLKKRSKFDKNGKVTEEELFENEEVYQKVTHKYDSKGNKLVENTVTLVEGKPMISFRTENEYDKNGFLICTRKLEYSDGNFTQQIKQSEWIYENDRHGNWIKQTSVLGGIPNEIIERKIKYY